MGYLYRPKLKDPTPPPGRKGRPCKHKGRGRTDQCPKCGARFSGVWWVKYYVNGQAVRESTETEKETEAERFLKTRRGTRPTAGRSCPAWTGPCTRRWRAGTWP
jgi:hypothetical protein